LCVKCFQLVELRGGLELGEVWGCLFLERAAIFVGCSGDGLGSGEGGGVASACRRAVNVCLAKCK